MYYNLSNYDYYGKGYESPSIGKQNAGREFKIHLNNENNSDNDDDKELDEFVEEIYDAPASKIKKKIVSGVPMTATDFYSNKNKDRAAGQLKNTGGVMYEFKGHHRNYARKGISPFKQPKHSGGPIGTGGSGQAFKTTGNFVGIGTQYGSSRPHKILTKIEDDRIFNISDMNDPMERSFKRQQNKIKKVLSIIKEYVSIDTI